MFQNQITLKNLRLMATLKEGQYLSTSSSGDIECTVDDTAATALTSFIYRETWDSNLFALRKLYVSDVPDLLESLIEEDRKKELYKLKDLLEKSTIGLVNLKTIFNEVRHRIQLDCLIEDYLETQISYADDDQLNLSIRNHEALSLNYQKYF